ncbi:MAG: LysR family transcriptional regulator [Hyphomicrobiales bacterium]|nr:LysR family transcriptional regulator [Rhabdaerophilum calidifontis]MCA1952578.1 LysR family transcriptional regulator [Hyphomicrobiales bacterium]
MSASPPRLTIRIGLKADVAFGPGKADLLQGIEETGSIAAAGRRMGMSYKRAWYLIDTLNGYFREPLVVSVKGGKAGGGAHLTEAGKAVLAAYRQAERDASAATAAALATLVQLADP